MRRVTVELPVLGQHRHKIHVALLHRHGICKRQKSHYEASAVMGEEVLKKKEKEILLVMEHEGLHTISTGYSNSSIQT